MTSLPGKPESIGLPERSIVWMPGFDRFAPASRPDFEVWFRFMIGLSFWYSLLRHASFNAQSVPLVRNFSLQRGKIPRKQ